MATKLREARVMRETYRNQLTETHDVAASLETQPGLRSLFARRFARLEDVVKGFTMHHNQIIRAVADETLAAEELIRKEFQATFYEVEEIYYTLFPEKALAPASPAPSSVSVSTLQNIRLPKIPLRTFSGNFADWCPFYQSFNSAIHSNTQLADINKFQYLLSCLTGEPLNMVKSLTLSEDNYPIAYQALVDRYDNKRELASHYWNELKSTTKLTGESAKALRRLLDRFKENRSALQALKIADSLEDFLWFSMLLDRLDSETRRLFESEHRSQKDTVPSFATLSDFVEGQCRVLEAVGVVREPPSKPYKPPVYAHGPNSHPKVHAKTLVVGATTPVEPVSSLRCTLCGQGHSLRKCPTFLSKPAPDRFHTVKEERLCYNCLSSGHSVGTCPSAFSCKECKERHHSLLHFKRTRQAPTAGKPTPSQEPQVDAHLVTSCAGGFSSNSSRCNVLLATASVNVLDKWGNIHKTRALLDTGSQASFIVSSRANQLELPRSQSSVSIFGLGHTPSKPSLGTARCEILPRHGKGPAAIVNLVVLPQICGPLPNSPIDPIKADHVRDLDLADPEWYKPAPIEILLGSDVLQSVLLDGVVAGDSERPMALRTVFGWVLIGPVTVTESPVQTLLTCAVPSLDRTLRDFWQLEEVPSKPVVSPEDQQAEAIFAKSVYREPSGRFGVALPFKAAVSPVFENSRSVADRRWLALERRLRAQPDLKRLYGEFMTDYLASGHMSLLAKEPSGSECYFIPHHCVVKSERGAVKIRVVFDASAKAFNQVALNDELLIGPKLQNDIFAILLNFRSKPIVFTADIRQMYRQINVVPEHCRYQLIRYRFSESDPVQTYQLNTVTYGVSSAPYLAIRTLLHLADIGEKQYPLAARAIRKSIYVDDLVCAVDSEELALVLKAQLIELFAMGCFELRKWTSNRPALLQDLPESHCQGHPSTFEGSEDFSTKILGLQWHAGSDSFSFEVQPSETLLCTKRSMLSEVARIFDPLGFLAPVSFLVKHLIQRLWTLGLDWDAVPPEEICRQWRLLKDSLGELAKLKIPRPLFTSSRTECQLHAFCDASQRGYACVIYVRYLVEDVPQVALLTAKSKVAPLKCLSIPRLELCAAVLLAKLVVVVLEALKDSLKFEKVCAWTDSTVALTWIRSSPHRWKTFIANRVVYIQERVPPDCWRHVRTAENPADPASRGLLPDEIRSCSLWWAGPDFLRLPPDQWPMSPVAELIPAPDVPLEEAKVALVAEFPPDCFEDLLCRFSSLRKIQGIIAWSLRFVKNSRNHAKTSGALSERELHESLLVMVRAIQRSIFASEIAKLRKNEPCSKPFRKLSPFFDEAGVLRVGGRLKHSGLSFEAKHPALLPGRHRLTELITIDLHQRHSHPGINTMVYLLQQSFWVLSARRAVRHYLAPCYRCFRTRPSPLVPPMGDLPSLRVSQLKPFSCVGVDYGGPFTITMARTRGAKTLKAYLCLFVCFATKAIHVEVASDLSSDAFIAALRRFVARRGRCSRVHSDNGTNFVGANRELTRLMKSAVEAEAIEWHFNPPSAPHFGGLWESGIKSVKTHMSRVIGSQILTFEELSTLVVQVEALLNSRPLCSVSTDPNDLQPLSPGHFLTLEPLSSPPDPDLSHVQVNRLSRWQLVQRMQQQFWTRWRDEYLHTLSQRGKWFRERKLEPIDIGTLVLVKDELAPPLKWRTGRIEQLHPGADGICRVASVRTPQGLVKRAMVKLCPLPNQ